jgi:hypothetical protein
VFISKNYFQFRTEEEKRFDLVYKSLKNNKFHFSGVAVPPAATAPENYSGHLLRSSGCRASLSKNNLEREGEVSCAVSC